MIVCKAMPGDGSCMDCHKPASIKIILGVLEIRLCKSCWKLLETYSKRLGA